MEYTYKETIKSGFVPIDGRNNVTYSDNSKIQIDCLNGKVKGLCVFYDHSEQYRYFHTDSYKEGENIYLLISDGSYI